MKKFKKFIALIFGLAIIMAMTTVSFSNEVTTGAKAFPAEPVKNQVDPFTITTRSISDRIVVNVMQESQLEVAPLGFVLSKTVVASNDKMMIMVATDTEQTEGNVANVTEIDMVQVQNTSPGVSLTGEVLICYTGFENNNISSDAIAIQNITGAEIFIT